MHQAKTRYAKAREFNAKARQEIEVRDHDTCIFCAENYQMDGATWFGTHLKEYMHYIPRSKNGLGIPENGALGCNYHHGMLDNGNKGCREEMLKIFRDYLKSKYQNWEEKTLVYDKWGFLEGEKSC